MIDCDSQWVGENMINLTKLLIESVPTVNSAERPKYVVKIRSWEVSVSDARF